MGDSGGFSRRDALRVIGAGAAATTATSCTDLEGFFQQHYTKLSKGEMEATLLRLEKKYSERFGKEVSVEDTQAIPGVLYGYALNISKCKGYRDCVTACVEENNLSADPEMHYIRVLEIERGSLDLHGADHYYDHETVPKDDKLYLPVQCQQCDDPPCVKACPVDATWMEPDGVTVVDYDWCIGCRYCATACPYWSRKFNWSEPNPDPQKLNTQTHYLSNRPRKKGVMEKCTFCLQRTRKGKQPACMEACPTGARVFGNLLDPKSEIRYILENKIVFRLKEELNTEPKFWYYMDG
jgi:molybdopterin-containing oxidoreductase family iron-sulfur binding subunit